MFTLATDLMVGSAPPQRVGAAAGVAEVSSEVGGALGIAVLGCLITAVYRGQWPAPSRPASPATQPQPPATPSVERSRRPGGSPANLAPRCLMSREAFTVGMQSVDGHQRRGRRRHRRALAAVVLRGVRPAAEPEGPPRHPGPDGPCAGKVGAVQVVKAPRPAREQARDSRHDDSNASATTTVTSG